MFEEELDRYWKTVVNTIQDGVMIVDRSEEEVEDVKSKKLPEKDSTM